jgi:hypothetical protein
MYAGKLVFSRVMDHLPMHVFRRCVLPYQGERYVKQFRYLDQYLVTAFAQPTNRESRRGIKACLRPQRSKLYHMGVRSGVARNTLSRANERRDWSIYADFAQVLIRIARPLHAEEDLGLDLDNTVHALDALTFQLPDQQLRHTGADRGRSLHNSTDFKPDPVRENFINSIACGR